MFARAAIKRKSPVSNMTTNVTIVVPIYGDWPSLKECIESLINHVDLSMHQILLVNDCGPDADMIEKNIQALIHDIAHVRYERNPKNLGFVGTCNRAVEELDKTSNDILLLNSDTKVTPGFLDELQKVLYESSKNGAVTPRSNNATLATIPLSAAPQKGIAPEDAFAIFLKIRDKLPRSTVVPVAHGFCMLIRRDLIKKYGLFDTVFGKGYGEEVDFCQRIRKDGNRCLLANRAFVFHLEARSFSLETKAKLLETNNKIIWKRYPHYREQVREYMQQATKTETAIEKSVGVDKTYSIKDYVKSMVRKNKHVNRVARRLRRSNKR